MLNRAGVQGAQCVSLKYIKPLSQVVNVHIKLVLFLDTLVDRPPIMITLAGMLPTPVA
jgi:hypothetical protein